MRVFIKEYDEQVYIKVRVELISKQSSGGHLIFVMSFHYAQHVVEESGFPYLKG